MEIDKEKSAMVLINAMRNELRAVLDFPATNKSDDWRSEVEMTIKTAELYIYRVGRQKPNYMNYENA